MYVSDILRHKYEDKVLSQSFFLFFVIAYSYLCKYLSEPNQVQPIYLFHHYNALTGDRFFAHFSSTANSPHTFYFQYWKSSRHTRQTARCICRMHSLLCSVRSKPVFLRPPRHTIGRERSIKTGGGYRLSQQCVTFKQYNDDCFNERETSIKFSSTALDNTFASFPILYTKWSILES